MEVFYRCCCGTDVHKRMIAACLDEGGRREEKIIANEMPGSDEVSQMIHSRMRPKLDQFMEAIDGITTPLQRRLLAQIIDHIDDLNRRVAVLDEMVEGYYFRGKR